MDKQDLIFEQLWHIMNVFGERFSGPGMDPDFLEIKSFDLTYHQIHEFERRQAREAREAREVE